MENQSFEKLLKVRWAFSFRPFPYNDISFAACESARMRKSLETVHLTAQLPDTITSYPMGADK
jgi:hypothetical protein